MAAKTPEVFEFLLNCQICLEPFDQKVCIPRVLPCHHTFCSPCIAKLDRGGNLACPNDRKEFRVSGPFPVDFTRAAVVEHKDLLQKGGASSPIEEVCQKHQNKKLDVCKTAEQKTKQTKTVSSWSTGVAQKSTVTSSTILNPVFQLEPGRCRAGCTLWEDCKELDNERHSQSGGTGQSGPRPFAFLGTCGSVDLAQPALHYWTVTFSVWEGGSGDRCEIGLASLQTLDTCGEHNRISDHDVNSATLVVVVHGDKVTLEGRNWTKDVDTPQPRQRPDVTYTRLWKREINGYLERTLGFLYDNRQPQSPRVLVVKTKSCRLLGVRRLSPSPDLRPVLRVWPARHEMGYRDASLVVGTGHAALVYTTAKQLQNLVKRTDRK